MKKYINLQRDVIYEGGSFFGSTRTNIYDHETRSKNMKLILDSLEYSVYSKQEPDPLYSKQEPDPLGLKTKYIKGLKNKWWSRKYSYIDVWKDITNKLGISEDDILYTSLIKERLRDVKLNTILK